MAGKLSDDAIKEAVGGLSGWSYDGARAITKTFEYPDHVAAVGFVMRLATAAEAMNHHPEISWVYNKVEVALSSHDVGGVSERDIELAKKAEQYA